jgi:hypothetical protein
MEPQPPPSSGLPLILALGLGGLMLITCLMSLLGPALLYVVLIGGGVMMLGGLHYWLWGQGMAPDKQSDETE